METSDLPVSSGFFDDWSPPKRSFIDEVEATVLCGDDQKILKAIEEWREILDICHLLWLESDSSLYTNVVSWLHIHGINTPKLPKYETTWPVVNIVAPMTQACDRRNSGCCEWDPSDLHGRARYIQRSCARHDRLWATVDPVDSKKRKRTGTCDISCCYSCGVKCRTCMMFFCVNCFSLHQCKPKQQQYVLHWDAITRKLTCHRPLLTTTEWRRAVNLSLRSIHEVVMDDMTYHRLPYFADWNASLLLHWLNDATERKLILKVVNVISRHGLFTRTQTLHWRNLGVLTAFKYPCISTSTYDKSRPLWRCCSETMGDEIWWYARPRGLGYSWIGTPHPGCLGCLKRCDLCGVYYNYEKPLTHMCV